MTIEERAIQIRANKAYPIIDENATDNDIRNEQFHAYCKGAMEQKAIDIEAIPQLFVRWLMIEGEKPSWLDYVNKAMEE